MTSNDSVTLYRRALPESQIAFSSPEGRLLFAEALANGTLSGFFPLIEQFHTQADPAYCGLASLVMCLNALAIDPGRVWRGPWRWFSEELLDCCTPLDKVKQTGLSLDEVACLARCNGAETTLYRAEEYDLATFRNAIEQVSRRDDKVLVTSYARPALGQTGDGHFSPIGGYHSSRDLVLLLDVARFKYPPHWVKVKDLYFSMREPDKSTGRSRGWLQLSRRGMPSIVAKFFSCPRGVGIREVLVSLIDKYTNVNPQGKYSSAAEFLVTSLQVVTNSGLSSCFELRATTAPEDTRIFAQLREQLTNSHLFCELSQAAKDRGMSAADIVTTALWLLTAPQRIYSAIPKNTRTAIESMVEVHGLPAELAAEIINVRSQIEFLIDHLAYSAGCSGSAVA